MLLGHGCLGAALFEGLRVSENIEVVAVFRWSNRKNGKQFLDEDEKRFGRRVRAAEIPDLTCPGANSYQFMQLVETYQPDVILIGSWGEILKRHVLTLPDCKVINCHPSLLPAHRGANPYVSTIRAGEIRSGVTFHYVDEQIDSGPVLMQEEVVIQKEDTGGSLRDRCALAAEAMVPKLMATLTSGKTVKPLKQELALMSYFPPMKMEDGQIHWHWEPEDIYNQVRALQPWLDCYSFLEWKVFLTFPKLELAQQPKPSGDPPVPGSILSYKKNTLYVASRDPETLLCFSQFRIYCFFFFLPKWFSAWVGYVLFRKGLVFSSP